MRKNWFYRMLFSYFPIFFSVTSVLILLSFLLLSEFSRRETVNANVQYVRHLIQLVDHSLQGIDDALIKEIETDEKLRLYFEAGDSQDYFNTYEISKKLNEMVTFNNLIDSMYLYRYSDQMILSSNILLPLNAFGDRDFVLSRTSSGSFYELSPMRTYIEFQDQGRVPPSVVSIVRPYPLLQGGQGLFVVNINLAKINKMVEGLSGSNVSFVEIRDKDGHVVAGPGNGGGKLSGTVLSHVVSDYTGWSYTGGVYDENIFRYASLFSYIWVGAGLIVVIAGTVWITYVTRRNYRPIVAIMDRINLYSSPHNGNFAKKAQDEFKFIEQALDSLIEQANTYQKMHEEDSLFRRRHFFVELLEGSRPIGMEEWRTELARYGLNPQFESIGIMVYEIDRYGRLTDKYSYRDQYLLKFVLNSIVKETADSCSVSVWTEWTAPHQLTALYHFPKDSLQSEQEAALLAEKVRGWVESNLDFTVTVGVSETVDELPGIVSSYSEAMKALTYKASLGYNRVILPREAKVNEDGTYRQLPLIPKLAHAFRTGEDEWLPIYGQIIGEALSNRASREELVQLLNVIVQQLYREMMEFPVEVQDIWKTETMPRLNQLRDTFDLAEDMEKEFASVLSEFADKLRAIQESRSHYALIRNVKEYIEREYANPDLSLNHLCDVFGLNGKYVSRLFKEAFGEKLVDYMVRVRIEKSQNLLTETSYSLQQIANEVGYIHDISYIRAFKKVIGTTPGDYRKQHAKSL